MLLHNFHINQPIKKYWTRGSTKQKKNKEVDPSQIQKLEGAYEDVITNPKNANAVFDYGRILTAVLQPGLASATTKTVSQGGKKL